jgi:hypothetical protein
MPSTAEKYANSGEIVALDKKLIAPRLPTAKQIPIESFAYENNPRYKARIARHKRRTKGRQLDYFARSYSGEYYILRALAVLHQILRIERDINKGFDFRALLFLLTAKQYLTTSGKDHFTARQIHKYSNAIFHTRYTLRASYSYTVLCEGMFFLNPLRTDEPTARRRYVLSMKARTLFRDIEREFKADYDVMSYLHKDRV